jgi:hypothetical protein
MFNEEAIFRFTMTWILPLLGELVLIYMIFRKHNQEE